VTQSIKKKTKNKAHEAKKCCTKILIRNPKKSLISNSQLHNLRLSAACPSCCITAPSFVVLAPPVVITTPHNLPSLLFHMLLFVFADGKVEILYLLLHTIVYQFLDNFFIAFGDNYNGKWKN